MPPTILRNIGIGYHALLLRGSDGSDTLRCTVSLFKSVATSGTVAKMGKIAKNTSHDHCLLFLTLRYRDLPVFDLKRQISGRVK